MSNEIMLFFGEDGVAREYDDTWDISIHCESEEEQKAVWEKLKNSNQEPQELSKNSPKLDKENGDLQPTCNQLEKDICVPCKDTISRQAAIDAILGIGHTAKLNDGDTVVRMSAVNYVLRNLPPAQPEIIRCRDCKYWREHKYAKETKRYIPFCGFNAIYTKSDDFCSHAERRADE